MHTMPMRTDCRHCESRTYESGEVVWRCKLDLAPEAPFRCPEDCSGFSARRMDAGWHYGSLRHDRPADTASEPTGDDVAALLGAAEEIVNSAAPDILAELESPKRRRRRRKGR